MVTAVETPFAFFEEQKETFPRDAIKPSEVAFRLVPEVLDSIYVALAVNETLGVIDPNMMKIRDIQSVVALESVCVDDAVGQNHPLHDRQQSGALRIWDHDRVHLASSLQQTKNWNFTGGSSAPFALSDAAEVALVDLNFSNKGRDFLHFIGNDFPQSRIEGRRSVTVDPDELSCGAGCCPCNEMFNEPPPLMRTQPTFPDVHDAILTLSRALS